MLKDRFDILLGVLLLLCGAALAGLIFGSGTSASQNSLTVDKALEKELAYQAKISFLERLYAPVTELREGGKNEAALLKLDELSRRYPDEAYGDLLRGEILLELGAVPQAVSSLARAVRSNGDFVDQQSPLSRRSLFDRLLKEQLPKIKARATAGGGKSAQTALQELYYLQGRLAGGCE